MAVSLVSTGVTFPDSSTQTTAATGFGFKNKILNGSMVIDQRNAGASVALSSSASFYATDRFTIRLDASSGSTAIKANVAPSGFTNSLNITIGTGAAPTSGQVGFADQRIEGFNIFDLGWGGANAQAITLSFWVRSSLTGSFGGAIRNSAVDRCYVFPYTINAANTWEYKTITINGDTSGTWLTNNGVGIYLSFDIGEGSSRSTATTGSWLSANTPGLSSGVKLCSTSSATWNITGVQLEKGSTATSFDYRPYGTELALCQRYFETSYEAGTAVGSTSNPSRSMAWFAQSTQSYNHLRTRFSVYKRSQPTIVLLNPATGTVSEIRNLDLNTNLAGAISGTSVTGFIGTVNNVSVTVTVFLGYHYTASSEL
jgi:hypothetical protein